MAMDHEEWKRRAIAAGMDASVAAFLSANGIPHTHDEREVFVEKDRGLTLDEWSSSVEDRFAGEDAEDGGDSDT